MGIIVSESPSLMSSKLPSLCCFRSSSNKSKIRKYKFSLSSRKILTVNAFLITSMHACESSNTIAPTSTHLRSTPKIDNPLNIF